MIENKEMYAKMQEQSQWEATFRERKRTDLQRMNRLLEEQKYDEIVHLFIQEGYAAFYSTRNAFVNINLAVKIYIREEGLENHVFWNIKSMEQLQQKIQRLKFLIWRLEYVGDDETKELLLLYLTEHRPSNWLIKYLIITTALDKKTVILDFIKLFQKWNMTAYTINFLNDIREYS